MKTTVIRLLKGLGALGLALMILGCASPQPDSPLQDLPMTAWGQGMPPTADRYSPAQKRIMAIRAAELDAVAGLARLADANPGSSKLSKATDKLAFFVTWAQKADPLFTNGVYYIQATAPAPSYQAFANYTGVRLTQELATLNGSTTAYREILYGPRPDLRPRLPPPQLEKLLRDVTGTDWTSARRQDELKRIGRELGYLPAE